MRRGGGGSCGGCGHGALPDDLLMAPMDDPRFIQPHGKIHYLAYAMERTFEEYHAKLEKVIRNIQF